MLRVLEEIRNLFDLIWLNFAKVIKEIRNQKKKRERKSENRK
jgi:hypothetical protein